MDRGQTERYRWDDFELLPWERRLLYQGQPVELEPRLLDLLIELVRGGRAARSRDELLDCVWAGQVVEDATLSQAVSRLRTAIKDQSGKTLETLRGRGYRFNAEVSTDVSTDNASHRRDYRRPAIAAVLGLALLVALGVLILTPERAVLGERQRIAVMSFDTEEEAADWIRLGLSAIVADALPAHHHVDVVSSRTSFELAGGSGERDPRELLQAATGADYVLDADVQKVEGGWSLSYRLWQGPAIVWEDTISGGQLRDLVDQLNVSLSHTLDAPRRSKLLPTRMSASDFVNEAFARGRQARYEGDFKRAAELFELCLSEDPTLNAARYELSDALRRMGQYPEATEHAERAHAAALAAGDIALAADAVSTLGLIAWRQGNYDVGIERTHQALELHESEGRIADAAFDRNFLAILIGRRGDDKGATKLYLEALSAYRAIGDKAGEARTLNNLGWHAWNRGDHRASLDYDIRALEIQESLGLTSSIALTLNNLGVGFLHMGRIQEASDYLQRALDMRERIGDQTGMITTLGNLGLIAGWRGNQEEALRYVAQALDLAEEIGAPELEAHAHVKHGDLLMQTGDLAGAAAAFDTAETIWLELEIDSAVADIQLWRAELSLLQGDAAAAMGLLPDPAGVEEEAQRARAARLLGRAQSAHGETAAALGSFREAIAAGRAAGAYETVVRAAIDAAHLCLDTGTDCTEEFLTHTGGWHDEFAPAAVVRGRWLLASGQIELAAAEFRRARNLAPDRWTAQHESWLAEASGGVDADSGSGRR